jgi:hypothetical protein
MVWLNRLVLGLSTLLFTRIGLERLTDPVGAEAPHQITLGSAEALTNTRVSGGLFIALALLLLGAAIARQRHVWGLWLLATVSAVLTIVRVAGLLLDGPAPFTLFVLKPEVVITVLSAAALVVELQRHRPTVAQR